MEASMRLSNAQARDVMKQAEAEALPADHPALPSLERAFGPHTFFASAEGLHVVERGEPPGPEAEPAFLVRVAGWVDDRHSSLVPLRAEVTKVVDIGSHIADLPDGDPLAAHGSGRGIRGRG
jgi:hypothetical protein